ncbi:GNAT family N-acetyltransferase [Bailinhaonella thermotolerans]|uniref:GNAT family N-acetyltransferase n=1 Tax=Bailinhaonella thermotolerans TaxID=1070861 RepID=A0A3A4AWI2_9ACTN|nr:GNAT family N-acetyltransferase [Bailinhaonella thermotolerans]RJL32657.1 GNAT family N-acetyltransferase [Bailinhaonella thermotolerans]
MKVHVVRPGDLGDAELDRWRALQRAAPTAANPLLAPEFTLALGRHRDDVRVAVIEDATGVAGFFPYERRPLGVGRPAGMGLTDFQGMVYAPGLDLDARDLLRPCRVQVWRFDRVPADQRPFAAHAARLIPSAYMDLGEGFDAYLAGLRGRSPAFYRTAMYKRRKLARDHGELTFTWAATDHEALRRLMAWKSDQYRRTGRFDRFAQPWITGLVEDLHASGLTVVTTLYAGGRPVAGDVALRLGNTVVGWFPAYDPGFSRYSPGMLHHLRMAEAAAAAGVRHVEMGVIGGKRYKDWLKNGERLVAEGRVARSSLSAGLHWVGSAPAHRVRDLVLANPGLYRRADRVLKTYGRLRTTVAARRTGFG